MTDLANHTIASDATLLEALRRLNSLPGSVMTLFVVDADERIVGSITDGDIRRALISGVSLEAPVVTACHRNFRSVKAGAIDPEIIGDCRNKGIRLIPVIDDQCRAVSFIDLTRQRTVLPLRAVLMAGGRGERLRPMTLSTPKPLLKIEGKAIIDYNVEALAACGIHEIVVTTRYLAEQIHNHFAEPVAGVKVRCVTEDKPLGTIGAVADIWEATDRGCTLVMNSDLLTTISFEEMYLRHCSTDADVTIAVIPYQVSVPYAILTLDENRPDAVAAIEEKPSYSYYANAGIYIFSNSLLSTLVSGEHCDATDLIERAIAEGRKVTYYPIKGTWIDVGSPVDFNQAAELMRHHNSMAINSTNN